MSMQLTVAAKGETELGTILFVGAKVKYLGHVPGGMVKIELPHGEVDIAHPHCFKELR